jgi:succinate dehydrogenase / fumarate reductase flavoprotein subunit
MFNNFGIFRDGQSMDEGLKEIKQLQETLTKLSPNNKDRAVNQTLIQFLELEGMLNIAEVVAYGAIERKESRGSHTRTDHPERDDDHFLKHTLAALKDGNIDVKYKPVTLGMFEPKERVY